jgi:viologen exporter family transport system permease protein
MTASLRPYLAILAARFALLLQYRTAALAGFGTQMWWGVIKILVLAAFYRSAPHQPQSLTDSITYVWMGQGFLGILPWNADPELVQMVETGNVGYERLRPVDTYAYWFMRALAWRTAAPLLRVIPMFLFAALALPLAGLNEWSWRPPATLGAADLFLASMTLTILLSSAMTTLINIGVAAARTGRGTGMAIGLVTVLSGMTVPLALLPGWMQRFLFWQPFAGLVDIPYRIYFANLTGAHAVQGLIAQTIWFAAFVLIGRLAMRSVMSRVDMQGG